MEWLRGRPYLTLWIALALTLLGITVSQIDSGEGPAHFDMPPDPSFVKACGRCHTPFAPGLLTVGEWNRVMDTLQDHYGDDASLDGPSRLGILRWLEEGAADGPEATRLMQRIAETQVKTQDLPRITTSRLFRYQHQEIPAHVWTRKSIGRMSHCGACHIRAETGRYDRDEVKIPR